MSRAATHRVAAVVLLLSPLMMAAADPEGDVAPCPGVGGVGATTTAPDLLSARAEIVELGTSALWTLEFDRPLVVPDEHGTPFRVDVVMRDPDVPAVSFAYYRGLNRLIRYDAVADPTLTILLLPEAAQNTFLPARVDGATMQIQVPGRILSADEDETGTGPGIDRLRWSVIVRDEGMCDRLGAGRPAEPFVVAEPPASPGAERAAEVDGVDPIGSDEGSKRWWDVVAAATLAGAALAGALYVRRRRAAEG